MNAILDAMAQLAPRDRVISIEETMELQCAVENSVDLRAVGSVTMLDCLRACMRLKPARMVVGEVRGAEAHVMLKAWNTGHPGGVATVHANDALSGLVRLESLVAEATAAPRSLTAEAIPAVRGQGNRRRTEARGPAACAVYILYNLNKGAANERKRKTRRAP